MITKIKREGDNMSKVIEQLNQIQADANILYIQFHNYHWNVKGLQFVSIHNYTEEAYEEMSTLFDDAAERAIQLGGKAIVCPKTLMETSKVEPLKSDTFCPKDVVEGMKKSYEYLLKAFKKLREVADEKDDSTTVAFAEDHIAGIEKRIWMLNAMLG